MATSHPLRDVTDPAIVDDGDVIVGVEMGSGLRIGSASVAWAPRGLDAGTVLGHEMTGRVVAIGRGVRQLALGIM